MAWWKYEAAKIHPWRASERVRIGGWPAAMVLASAVAFLACYAMEDIGEGSAFTVGGMVAAFILCVAGLCLNDRRNRSKDGAAPEIRAGRTRSRG